MKERLLSIASGGKRKKGVALICAAALVISAGAAACSWGVCGGLSNRRKHCGGAVGRG